MVKIGQSGNVSAAIKRRILSTGGRRDHTPASNNTSAASTATHNNVNFIRDSHFEVDKMVSVVVFLVIPGNGLEMKSESIPVH